MTVDNMARQTGGNDGTPEAAAPYLASLLPPAFRGCGCVIQATASAGIKPGIRARLWYLTDRSVGDAEAARWLAEAPVDRSLYRPVQAHYTAAPGCQGVPDPMPWRVFLVPGEHERVPVLPEPEPSRPLSAGAGEQRGSRYARAALAEPEWPALLLRELLKLAFAERAIASLDHPVVKRLRGLA